MTFQKQNIAKTACIISLLSMVALNQLDQYPTWVLVVLIIIFAVTLFETVLHYWRNN